MIEYNRRKKRKERKILFMVCPKCGSTNVNVQAVGNVKSRGGVGSQRAWLLYWLCFGWAIDLMLYCCIIGFFGFTIHHYLKKRAYRTKTDVETYALCQECGHKYKV